MTESALHESMKLHAESYMQCYIECIIEQTDND